MKNILIVLILISSTIAYAGDPYVKTFYKGKNWTVLEVGINGESKQCALRSLPFYLDNGKNPKYGTTYLKISYPSDNVTFSGENIGAYFKISKRAMLQVDNGEKIAIIPETPMPGKSIVDNMMKGMTAKITIDFGGGPLDIHTFSLLGFTKAYNMLQDCAGTPSGPAKDDLPPQGARVTLNIDLFLMSGFAKQYGITKQDGWALRDGSYNNELSVSRLQETTLSASTKGSNIVDAGVMFRGTTSLDSSKMSFVLELLKTFDPSIAQLSGIRDGLSKSLYRRVSQIDLAPAHTYGKLQVRAANVAGTAVISIELQ
ncbi:MAG: hypothetical protein PHP23_04585 [Desulfobacterales bacterium]|nr:hypothetical protein [Desulfobacterales bacterium]MDD4071679.1 hypothetical protein [Desulfobacterales bacterium]MDD4393590.1 hypothetical protein [Desulfobacterales bacterium]